MIAHKPDRSRWCSFSRLVLARTTKAALHPQFFAMTDVVKLTFLHISISPKKTRDVTYNSPTLQVERIRSARSHL